MKAMSYGLSVWQVIKKHGNEWRNTMYKMWCYLRSYMTACYLGLKIILIGIITLNQLFALVVVAIIFRNEALLLQLLHRTKGINARIVDRGVRGLSRLNRQ